MFSRVHIFTKSSTKYNNNTLSVEWPFTLALGTKKSFKLFCFLIDLGDILAKSFKWIYAKLFLCRICPGVAKRRAMRERRKIRALAQNNINEVSYRESFFFVVLSLFAYLTAMRDNRMFHFSVYNWDVSSLQSYEEDSAQWRK